MNPDVNFPLGAHAIVCYEGKILLMLRDNKPEIAYPNTWHWLGGVIEEDEDPKQALKRELKEEANIETNNIRYLMKKPSGRGPIYYVKLNKKDVENIKLGDEGQRLNFFDLNELKKLKLGGYSFQKLVEFHWDLLEKLIKNSG